MSNPCFNPLKQLFINQGLETYTNFMKFIFQNLHEIHFSKLDYDTLKTWLKMEKTEDLKLGFET